MIIILANYDNPHLQNLFPDVHLLLNNEVFKLLYSEVITS